MNATREFAVVLPLAPLHVAQRFRRAAWPRHVTVVPNVRTEADAVDALAAIVREAAAGVGRPRGVVAAEADFGAAGDVPVQLVDGADLDRLHAALDAAIDAWAAESAAPLERLRPEHHGPGYRAHVTVTPAGRLDRGAALDLATIALVEIGPDGDAALAEPVAVAEFGRPADAPVAAADHVARVCAALDAAGVRFVVVGGWGVDALVGRATRDHHDLDLLVEHADLGRLLDRAEADGGGIRYLWSESRRHDELPTAFVAAFDGLDLDVHTVARDGDRVGLLSASTLELPPGALSASGAIAGREVVCATVAAQRMMHTGYELPEHHRRDLALLDALDG